MKTKTLNTVFRFAVVTCTVLILSIVLTSCCGLFPNSEKCGCSTCFTSEDITFMHDNIKIYGTITIPEKDGRYPAIIISPGSGNLDRDLTRTISNNTEDRCLYPLLVGKTFKPYKQLAEGLSQKGYIVLRYDKPEFTYPLKDGFTGEINFERIWLTTGSAIAYLKTRAEVDTNRIILAGHSEGSFVIPYISKGRKDIEALISIAGPARPLDSMVAYQYGYLKTNCSVSGFDYDAEAQKWLTYFGSLRKADPDNYPGFLGLSAPVWYDYILMNDNVFANYNACRLPTLFLHFNLDWNVPPYEQSRLMNNIKVPADFVMVPDLVHYMIPKTETVVPASLIDEIDSWLKGKGL